MSSVLTYLSYVDYTTNVFDISLLSNKRSATVATYTKKIFFKLVIPKKVESDKGPKYIGHGYIMALFEHIRKFQETFSFLISCSLYYNHGKNICRLLQILAQFSFTTSERKLDCYNKKVNIRVASQAVERLKT